ncbi:hypothetical protein ACI3QN_12565, partial [Propionibacterium freudenreichii]|uniref:hypothetical protein n=1 Tax=Propionibacterium freudenreichii TaxID=1744 RepID=UPI0038547C0A
LEKEIEIAKVRFEHTYDILPAEIDSQLKDAGGMPGSLFRLNMIQKYGFKDLPLMMHNLADSVIKVPEKVKDADGRWVHNSYNLYLQVRKGT